MWDAVGCIKCVLCAPVCMCMCLIKLFLRRIFYEPLNNRAVNKKMDEEQNSWLWYKVFSMDIHICLEACFSHCRLSSSSSLSPLSLSSATTRIYFTMQAHFMFSFRFTLSKRSLQNLWAAPADTRRKKSNTAHTIRVECVCVCVAESEWCLLN